MKDTSGFSTIYDLIVLSYKLQPAICVQCSKICSTINCSCYTKDMERSLNNKVFGNHKPDLLIEMIKATQ